MERRIKPFFSESEWRSIFEKRGAFWRHDGNPKRPHAKLSKRDPITGKEKHSNGFFNGGLIVQDAYLLHQAAHDLIVQLLELSEGDCFQVDRFVGPAMGAITIPSFLALQYQLLTNHRCLTTFAEKVPKKHPHEPDLFRFNRADLKPGECICVCEDVVTTFGSGQGVVHEIERLECIPSLYVPCLFNRSGKKWINGRRIMSLVEIQMDEYVADECPDCKLGSEPIGPKTADNWARLNATY